MPLAFPGEAETSEDRAGGHQPCKTSALRTDAFPKWVLGTRRAECLLEDLSQKSLEDMARTQPLGVRPHGQGLEQSRCCTTRKTTG